jgi:hypothetical protein
MILQNVAISDGQSSVKKYTVYLATNNIYNGTFFNITYGDLLKHSHAKLYLSDSSTSSVIIKGVDEIFLAPRADFFVRPDLTTLSDGVTKYGEGYGAVTDRLIYESGRLAEHAPQNPITNILLEGLNSPNIPNRIEDLSNIRNIIDYVFSKPHLLYSFLLILRNEGGAQHLFADKGNVPHRNQLILNMARERELFVNRLHSGTQFGIASYFHYDRGIYKSVFDLDIADYIVISISYYPMVSHSGVTYDAIRSYYDSRIGDYRYSVYSFHLWRHSLYGGFAGVVRGSIYASDGYTLRPECACKALLLQIDAQTQQTFKEGWYAVLYVPTAFYILLLHLAMEAPNSKHDSKAINEALKRLNNIENEKDSLFYKKVIKRFTDEIREDLFFQILKSGIRYIKDMKLIVDRSNHKDYQNPLQMVWNFCKARFLLDTHKAIIDRYKNYARTNNANNEVTRKINRLESRLNIVTSYIDNKFKSIGNIYDMILREEQKFFDGS